MRTRFLSASISVVVSAVAMIGCKDAPPPTTSLSPQESFEAIAKVVRDGIELRGTGGAPTIVSQDAGARSRFSVVNTVESNFLPPKSASDPIRGTITVVTKSIYTLSQTEEKKDDELDSQQSGFSMLEGIDESSDGVDVLDRELVTTPTDEKNGGETTEIRNVQRHADEDVRSYDLLYNDGRWELTSKLDEKTERSVKNAIERALRMQP